MGKLQKEPSRPLLTIKSTAVPQVASSSKRPARQGSRGGRLQVGPYQQEKNSREGDAERRVPSGLRNSKPYEMTI